jgi:hypothetical protein
MLLAPASRANADMITIFNATGTLADGGTLSGTVTIDTTIGAATALDLIVQSPHGTLTLNSANPASQTDWPPYSPPRYFSYEEYPPPSNPIQYEIGMVLPNIGDINLIVGGQSLVGYTGGPLSSVSDATGHEYSTYDFFSFNTGNVNLVTGGLKPVAQSTPEPGTLTMLGTAIFALGGLRFCHRRQGECANPSKHVEETEANSGQPAGHRAVRS